jgi:hypothetical protein
MEMQIWVEERKPNPRRGLKFGRGDPQAFMTTLKMIRSLAAISYGFIRLRNLSSA